MKPIVALIVALSFLTGIDPIIAAELTRSAIPGEVIVLFASDQANASFDSMAANWQTAPVAPDFAVESTQSILSWKKPGDPTFSNLMLVRFPKTIDLDAVRNSLSRVAGVEWTAPNYQYAGDPRELTPNDPQYGSQYHHPLMKNNLAWDITTGSPSILIAITDDGFSKTHPDLAPNMWVNPGEIAGDLIDNDLNGFIDDVNGWDFAHNNNDVNPNNSSDAHGTHVCGIAAARTNNAIGVAGTAGGATFMPIQFYDSTLSWTSSHVAFAFSYAVNNGARIITMSYNIDNFVNDPTARTAFQYAYDHEVLYFNSAGNSGALNPARQAIHEALLVANTTSTDARSSSSNYGTGIDIAAPGTNILSTIPGNTYGLNSGTSMASPNAAGVAALIWSANPTWTRDQVAARLYATADNIDGANPSIAGLLGGGRVNSFAAVSSTPLPAPKVRQVTGLPANGAMGQPGGAVTLRFNQIMSPAAANDPGAFRLVGAGEDATIGTVDDVEVPMSQTPYLIGSNEIVFTVGPFVWTSGVYAFVADASVLVNPFDTALDGNGDGVPGDSWTSTFVVCTGASRSNCGTCAADMDGNAHYDARDMQKFVECAVTGNPNGAPGCGCADIDGDGTINQTDARIFVELLVEGQVAACCGLDGVCFITSSAGCAAVGGNFDPTKSDCIGVSCPQPCLCLSPVTVYPYVEDFQGQTTCSANCTNNCNLTGGWSNAHDGVDNADWIADSGGTPSSNTGPTIDSNPGSAAGVYLYTEASSCFNRQSDLISPCFDISALSNPTFSFDYHMFGASMGSLQVDVSTANCFNWITLATLTGQQQTTQGEAWRTQMIDLSAFAGSSALRIRLRGVTGAAFTSDMAIDNMRLTGS